MKTSCGKPCPECPFVKGRTQGYIGEYESGDELHRLATMDVEFPCHKTMGTKSETNCRGISIYRKAICKHMGDENLQNLQDEIVKANPAEVPAPPFRLGEYHASKFE